MAGRLSGPWGGFWGERWGVRGGGEGAGRGDELLLASGDYFDKLLADTLGTVTGLINPILTMFTGLFVAGMMVAIFMPVFQMGNVAGG